MTERTWTNRGRRRKRSFLFFDGEEEAPFFSPPPPTTAAGAVVVSAPADDLDMALSLCSSLFSSPFSGRKPHSLIEIPPLAP